MSEISRVIKVENSYGELTGTLEKVLMLQNVLSLGNLKCRLNVGDSNLLARLNLLDRANEELIALEEDVCIGVAGVVVGRRDKIQGVSDRKGRSRHADPDAVRAQLATRQPSGLPWWALGTNTCRRHDLPNQPQARLLAGRLANSHGNISELTASILALAVFVKVCFE